MATQQQVIDAMLAQGYDIVNATYLKNSTLAPTTFGLRTTDETTQVITVQPEIVRFRTRVGLVPGVPGGLPTLAGYGILTESQFQLIDEQCTNMFYGAVHRLYSWDIAIAGPPVMVTFWIAAN